MSVVLASGIVSLSASCPLPCACTPSIKRSMHVEHRALLDERQKFAGGSFGFAAHRQHAVRRVEVRQFSAHLGQFGAE